MTSKGACGDKARGEERDSRGQFKDTDPFCAVRGPRRDKSRPLNSPEGSEQSSRGVVSLPLPQTTHRPMQMKRGLHKRFQIQKRFLLKNNFTVSPHNTVPDSLP